MQCAMIAKTMCGLDHTAEGADVEQSQAFGNMRVGRALFVSRAIWRWMPLQNRL